MAIRRYPTFIVVANVVYAVRMKRKGKHPDKALTAVHVRQAKTPGRYADGNGLYLIVDPSGAKRWVLRTVVQGVRRDIGLGGVMLVSLAEAREKALAYRKVARDGGDPVADRRKAKIKPPTFAEAAEQVHRDHEASWTNSKHIAQWITTLRTYVFPMMGERPVNLIDTPEVLKVLAPIWLEKPETARRVRQRISTVFDWARAAGHRTGDNPVDGVSKGLPKQTDRDEHHKAMPYVQVPAFVQRLRESDGLVELAFELLILTAARTGELLGMKWGEVNLEAKSWTIPAARMKAKREHRVPLTDRGVEILKAVKRLSSEGDFVFPGRSGQKPLSNMVFLMTLRRMKLDVTAHGFRSAFRDWTSEQTSFPRDVCEMALAHSVSNKVEAAYRRGDLFDKRRELMNEWGVYVHG